MRITTLSPVAGLVLMAASSAHAQAYVGGNVGGASISVDCSGLPNCDRSETGFKAYGGYRFGQGFAVEGVYFDWGKATAQGGTQSAEQKASGLGLGVAYFLPFATDFSVVGRLGAVRNRSKWGVNGPALGISGPNVGVSESGTTNSWQAYAGIGVAYKLMPNLAVTAEADFSRIKVNPAGVSDTSRSQLYSLGLRLSF